MGKSGGGSGPENGATAVTLDTPDGPFSLVASLGAILASGWTDDLERLRVDIHPSLRPSTVALVPVAAARADPAAASPTAFTPVTPVTEAVNDTAAAEVVLGRAASAVTAYYAGQPEAIMDVPVRQAGGAFWTAVWRSLRLIPYGQHLTYSELAAAAGRPRAVRAAGSACAGNACALLVPCHRAVHTDPGRMAFGYGVPLKQQLLAREAAWAGAGEPEGE
ncbi:MAG: methylated-DNA--[protein]-cysteine S-methyltransferase [Propionibacteriaceae bacterium]|jgi:O-6-methylguanine DNA methyltransferase|nr:methylated-DNA--[protein]-cysteine S-methyltransferase [Propionibacteriaceae bacterium]